MARDYQKDLELCNPSTPWVYGELHEFTKEALPYYIKRCMELEQQKYPDELLKELGRERIKVQELEMQVGELREVLLMTHSTLLALNTTIYTGTAMESEVKQALQSTTHARLEKMQKENLILKCDINSLKIALESIDDECVRFTEDNLYCDKQALRRIKRIMEMTSSALAELEGGGE